MFLPKLIIVTEKKGVLLESPITAFVVRTQFKINALPDLNGATVYTLDILNISPVASEYFVAYQDS